MKKLAAFLKETRAQAMVESAIVLPLFLTIVFGIMQMALVFNAKFILNYAAYTACRIGIVTGSDQSKMKEGAQIVCTGLEKPGISPNVNTLIWNYYTQKFKVQNAMTMTVDNPVEGVLHVTLEYQFNLIIPFGNAVIYTILNFRPDYKIADEEKFKNEYRIPIRSEYRMWIQP
ncbi:MAG: pilus assembly protein [Candidatus Aureabacteria bacterium]|nr:pilus assembly protein [Candidatus Auribacterota bacterium]